MKQFILATKKPTISALCNLASDTSNTNILYRLACIGNMNIDFQLAQNPCITTKMMKLLLDRYRNNADIVEYIADNDACDDEIIKYILDTGCTLNIAPSSLVSLATSANDPELQTQLLNYIISSDDSDLRAVLADATDISYQTVAPLLYDACPDVRDAMAQRRDLPADDLEILLFDPDIDVRCHAMENPNKNKQLVLQYFDSLGTSTIAEDECAVISAALKCNKLSYTDVHNLLNSVLSLDPSKFESAHARDYVLDEFIESDRLSGSDLLQLGEMSTHLLSSVIDKKGIDNVPAELIARLCQKLATEGGADIDVEVDISDDLLIDILERTKDPNCLHSCVDHHYWRVRETVARNRFTLVEDLKKLCNDADYDVSRYAANTLSWLKIHSPKEKLTSSNPVVKDKTPSTYWAVSPFEIRNYNELEPELGVVIPKVMKKVGSDLGCTLTYQFDNDYDYAVDLTVTTSTGDTYVLDAQQFLATLTSDVSKIVGSKRAVQDVERGIAAANNRG